MDRARPSGARPERAAVVPTSAYGRAYGFKRAMDNLGAIFGPRSPSVSSQRSAHAGPSACQCSPAFSPRSPSSTPSGTPPSGDEGACTDPASDQTGALRRARSALRRHHRVRARQLRSDAHDRASHRPATRQPQPRPSHDDRTKHMRNAGSSYAGRAARSGGPRRGCLPRRTSRVRPSHARSDRGRAADGCGPQPGCRRVVQQVRHHVSEPTVRGTPGPCRGSPTRPPCDGGDDAEEHDLRDVFGVLLGVRQIRASNPRSHRTPASCRCAS